MSAPPSKKEKYYGMGCFYIASMKYDYAIGSVVPDPLCIALAILKTYCPKQTTVRKGIASFFLLTV